MIVLCSNMRYFHDYKKRHGIPLKEFVDALVDFRCSDKQFEYNAAQENQLSGLLKMKYNWLWTGLTEYFSISIWRFCMSKIKRIVVIEFVLLSLVSLFWNILKLFVNFILYRKICTRGIWKVMHIHPYIFTQWSEKKDEGISVNVRIWGFWGYHVLMFALMR